MNFHALRVESKVPVPVVVLVQTLDEFSISADSQVEYAIDEEPVEVTVNDPYLPKQPVMAPFDLVGH